VKAPFFGRGDLGEGLHEGFRLRGGAGRPELVKDAEFHNRSRALPSHMIPKVAAVLSASYRRRPVSTPQPSRARISGSRPAPGRRIRAVPKTVTLPSLRDGPHPLPRCGRGAWQFRRYFFWAAALRGLRLWMWPLSVPAVGSMTALIKAGFFEAIASLTALVRLGVSVQWYPLPPNASMSRS